MMTIKDIYDLSVKLGIEHDPRGVKRVRQVLARTKEEFETLKGDEREGFDQEKLTNPYSDSRLFTENPSKPVRRVLVGIDIDVAEVLLAKYLEPTKPIDLVISHHPFGDALASLHEVMHMQAEIIANYGVPINVAEDLMHKRMEEVSRRLSPHNHYQQVDAAQLLGVPLMCAHTTTDNLVTTFLMRLFAKRAKSIETVGDVLKALDEIPEYQMAKRRKAGPMLFSGAPKRSAGRLAFTELTGGTEGASEMYEKLAQAGVGTLVAMHMTEDRKDEATKHHVNVIVAGHISSDSIGMNLFLDHLERRGVEIIPLGGFLRVSRFHPTGAPPHVVVSHAPRRKRARRLPRRRQAGR